MVFLRGPQATRLREKPGCNEARMGRRTEKVKLRKFDLVGGDGVLGKPQGESLTTFPLR